MTRIQFNAPAHHKLEVDGEIVAYGGQETDVDEAVADSLIAEPSNGVTVARSTLASKSREDLNKLAAEAGVTDPESLPNKDAVIAAIEAPEAVGEGQSTTESEETS